MRRAFWRAPARNARDRSPSRRGRSGEDARQWPHPGGSQCDRRKLGSRPGIRRRARRLSICWCRAHQAGLRDRGLRRVEAIEWPADLNQLLALRFKSLPDCAVGQFGMLMRFGVGDASVEQPGVQLLVARHPPCPCPVCFSETARTNSETGASGTAVRLARRTPRGAALSRRRRQTLAWPADPAVAEWHWERLNTTLTGAVAPCRGRPRRPPEYWTPSKASSSRSGD